MLVDVAWIIGTHTGVMAEINWTLQQFNIDELTDYYKNPRSLSDKEFKQLKTSLDKFGMIDKPIVNADSLHTIIGGHQRKHVLEATGVSEIECWIPDRELSDKEVEELNIRLNKNTGSWDFDVLANEFELPDLVEWGFTEHELLHTSFDGSTLFDSFNDAVNSNSEFERVSLITDHNTANLIKAEIKKTSMDEFCLRVAEMLNA